MQQLLLLLKCSSPCFRYTWHKLKMLAWYASTHHDAHTSDTLESQQPVLLHCCIAAAVGALQL